MSVNVIISDQVKLLPKNLQKEVLDFIQFILQKKKQGKAIPMPPKADLAKGLVAMRDDFDEPLKDFKEYI